MDQDEDLLEKLDRKERESVMPSIWIMAGVGLLGGMVAYFTLRQQFNLDTGTALDAAGLLAAALLVVLFIASRGRR